MNHVFMVSDPAAARHRQPAPRQGYPEQAMTRHNLLGEFLQARRARVRPDEAGLASYGRRRVTGLRREELAEFAGISVQYLTRLEQGVDRHPSAQVVDALTKALRLDLDAARHLRSLACLPTEPPGPSEVGAEIQHLLDSWGDTPAYVRDRRFDVLAANKAAVALAPMYRPGRNLVREVFLDPAARSLFPDWPDIAEQTVAALRATADLRDPRTAALVSELQHHDHFRSLWTRYDVRPSRNETKRFDHPDAGPLTLSRQTLTIAGAEDQAIIVYQPEPGSASADALAKLLQSERLPRPQTPCGDTLTD
ncbi:helix-turn-helix domain-containing protein [Actinomadura sp. 7K534]|uniref:helix-turn-helix domain-containing protein n=1 Tax=Actinomadura sp. 7K534 TaxID=2530366 RepID=UPI001A9D8482|nr:helix-turn-helix domain-containing protein [Actinomadura sp. 7K534]